MFQEQLVVFRYLYLLMARILGKNSTQL